MVNGVFGLGSDFIAKLGQGMAGQGMAAQPGFLQNLFSNRLFLQMLGAAGADLSQGTGGKHTLEALTKNLAGGSFKELMGALMKGGADAKMTIGGDGSVSLKTAPGTTQGTQPQVPSVTPNVFNPQIPTTPAGSQPIGSSGTQPNNFSDIIGQMMLGKSFFAPSLSGLSASDLAGLGPEEIAQALTLKGNFDELGMQRLRDISDAMFRGSQVSDWAEQRRLAASGQDVDRTQAETARLNAIRALADEMRESPIEIPGIGKVDLKSFNALPEKAKAYAFYVFDQKKNSRAPLVYEAWEAQIDAPTLKKYYDLSKTDSGFKEFLMEYQERGSTKVSNYMTPEATALSRGKAEPWVQLQDPKLINAEVFSHPEYEAAKDSYDLAMLSDNKDKRDEARTEFALETAKIRKKVVLGMIAAGKGTIKNMYLKNGKMVIEVIKENGEPTVVSYALD